MIAEKQKLISWARNLASALGERCDKATQRSIDHAIESLNTDRFTLAVVGKAKRGKSTFINAILGRSDDKIAPVDRLPASSAVSKFHWSPVEEVVVYFRGGTQQVINYDRVREFVTEESNPDNSKGVELVSIAGPFKSLQPDFDVLDTPGAGSLHEYHDALLHSFIPQVDAVVFLVSARMPLDQDELELLQKVKACDVRKIFFAINRIDEVPDQDIEAAVAHNQDLLSQAGLHAAKIHRISAKRAHKGDLATSGVPALIDEIVAFVGDNKVKILKEKFGAKIGAAVGPKLQTIELELNSGLKTSKELDAEIASLEAAQVTAGGSRQLAAREFLHDWRKAVDEYAGALSRNRGKAVAAIVEKVRSTSLLSVSGLAKSLPTVLVETAEQYLTPAAGSFEKAAQRACRKLQADYPSLSLGDAGAVILTTREGTTAIAGVIGGTAAAAAGTSLVAAGTTAAASIAAANAAGLSAVTTTVAAPSVISSAAAFFGLEFLAPLATGTATVATPAALTTTPLWVALSGPVGWTIAGVGAVAIPLSWRVSKLKLKDQMESACKDQMQELFDRIKDDRLPELRAMGEDILEETELQFERRVAEIGSTLLAIKAKRPSEMQLSELRQTAAMVRQILAEY